MSADIEEWLAGIYASAATLDLPLQAIDPDAEIQEDLGGRVSAQDDSGRVDALDGLTKRQDLLDQANLTGDEFGCDDEQRIAWAVATLQQVIEQATRLVRVLQELSAQGHVGHLTDATAAAGREAS